MELDPARAGQRLSTTVRCYIKDVRSAFRWLAAHAIPATLARPADLQQYLDSLGGRYRPATIRRRSVGLRRVYQALADVGAIPCNPAAELHAPKRHQAARKSPLPTPTAKRLLAALQPSSVKGARDLIILTGMLCQALAVSEMCALNEADLDLAARTLRVTGRRERVRTVDLTMQTSAVFRRWLAARALFWRAGHRRFMGGLTAYGGGHSSVRNQPLFRCTEASELLFLDRSGRCDYPFRVSRRRKDPSQKSSVRSDLNWRQGSGYTMPQAPWLKQCAGCAPPFDYPRQHRLFWRGDIAVSWAASYKCRGSFFCQESAFVPLYRGL